MAIVLATLGVTQWPSRLLTAVLGISNRHLGQGPHRPQGERRACAALRHP